MGLFIWHISALLVTKTSLDQKKIYIHRKYIKWKHTLDFKNKFWKGFVTYTVFSFLRRLLTYSSRSPNDFGENLKTDYYAPLDRGPKGNAEALRFYRLLQVTTFYYRLTKVIIISLLLIHFSFFPLG